MAEIKSKNAAVAVTPKKEETALTDVRAEQQNTCLHKLKVLQESKAQNLPEKKRFLQSTLFVT